jgi:hypothetical protein
MKIQKLSLLVAVFTLVSLVPSLVFAESKVLQKNTAQTVVKKGKRKGKHASKKKADEAPKAEPKAEPAQSK